MIFARFKHQASFALVGALAVLIASASPAAAAPGDLDNTFDTDGKVTTDFAADFDSAFAVAIQADGKMVAAGPAVVSGIFNFGLARYNIDGSLDPTFDGDGKVTTGFAGGGGLARAVAIQGDGKIVAAGSAFVSGTTDFALARYNTDGSLDPTFDGDGKVTTDFAGGIDEAQAVAIQGDGKIVAAGRSGPFENTDFALARYNTDGSLDPTFDGDGKVTTDFAGAIVSGNIPTTTYSSAQAAPDHSRTLAAGSVTWTGAAALGANVNYNPGAGTPCPETPTGPEDQCEQALLQYTGLLPANIDVTLADDPSQDFDLYIYASNAAGDNLGFIDSSANNQTIGELAQISAAPSGSYYLIQVVYFATAPVLGYTATAEITDFTGTADEAEGVAIQADGKIVAAGDARVSGTRDFALARYNTDGSLDPTFDTDGRVITDFAGGSDEPRGVAIQGDGRIVAAGFTDSGGDDFALARYNTDGSLDPAFDADGKVTTDFAGDFDYADGVAIQGDGKIVAAGGVVVSSFDFGLARYNTDGSLDPTFGGDGKVTTDFGGDTDSANAVAIQGDGKIVAAGGAGSDVDGDFALARYTCFRRTSRPTSIPVCR